MERLIDLIKEHALFFGDFTLSSGIKSDYFIDMSKVTNHAEGLDIITSRISNLLDYKTDCIGGIALGSAPLVGGTILAHWRDNHGMSRPLRGFLVRKEEKSGSYFEGNLKVKDRVVLVEDVITTGKQIEDAVNKIESFGAEVVNIIVILDRLEEKVLKRKFISLLSIKDVL